jgi:hypothetical protein
MSLSDYDHTLIYLCIFLSATLLFTKNLSLKAVSLCVIFAISSSVLDPIGVLASLALPTGKNPQILTALIFPLVVIPLLASQFFKRFRSITRMMMSIASVAMLLTTILFHYILIQTILPAWGKEGAWAYSSLMEATPSRFDGMCKKENLYCFRDSSLNLNSVPEAYRNGVMGVDKNYSTYKGVEPVIFGYSLFNDLSTTGVAAILYSKSGSETRLVISDHEAIEIHTTIKWAFYLLCSVAHSVWLLGGLALILFHTRRFKKQVDIKALKNSSIIKNATIQLAKPL